MKKATAWIASLTMVVCCAALTATLAGCSQPQQQSSNSEQSSSESVGSDGFTDSERALVQKNDDVASFVRDAVKNVEYTAELESVQFNPDSQNETRGDLTLDFVWSGEGEGDSADFAAFADAIAKAVHEQYGEASSISVFLYVPEQGTFAVRAYSEQSSAFACAYSKWLDEDMDSGSTEPAESASASSSDA